MAPTVQEIQAEEPSWSPTIFEALALALFPNFIKKLIKFQLNEERVVWCELPAIYLY